MNSEIKDFIGVYENAYSKEFCEEAIKFFNDLEDIGAIWDRQGFEGAAKLDKDDNLVFLESKEAFTIHSKEICKEFYNIFWNACYKHYAEKFAVLKDSPAHFSYQIKAQRTSVGGGQYITEYQCGLHHPVLLGLHQTPS